VPAISLKGVELYNWQIDAVERWLASGTDWDIQGTFSVFTGGGKTVMALACAERVARFEPAVRTVIVVPTVALAIQWKDRILLMTNVGEADIGLRGAGRHDALDGKQVLIAVLNTAAKVLPGMVDSFDRPVMLIVDECHRAGAAKFSNVLGTRARYRLGLSATPERDEVGEEQPADHPRQVPGRVRHGREQRRPGVLEDEQGEGHEGEAIAADREDLGKPQGPELADREHVAERGTRRHSTLSR